MANQPRQDPIAVVGMDCRFPGGVESVEDYWTLLDSGSHFSAPLPVNRGWDLEWLRDPESSATGDFPIARGGFFDDVSGFDAGFFGMGPREATMMDPQQRLLLESAWRAVESARIPPRSLRGTPTGVYVGISDSNYHAMGEPEHRPGGANADLATGSSISVASGRISYLLDLRGPALSVDTACSSSLVAVHMAVRALRSGECDLAITSGVCVLATPDLLMRYGRAGALTGDGRCKAFAAEADGFAPSEGVVSVVLTPLRRALATGRPVLAVLRGSAVNHDGTGEGLTVPSGPAQRSLIAEALDDAALSPGQVDLVEAHGTGTKVGDPIEARSIQLAYGGSRDPDLPVWIGSGKSNIGHTQQAAGLAGLVKVILSMTKQRMPATLHVGNPTPEVDWSAGNVRLLRDARDWPRGDRVRRAGVLSYGIGGTNAHLIVEEPPEPAPRRLPVFERPATPPQLWPLSAASEDALREQAAILARWVRDRPAIDPADVGRSLATTRTALRERAVVRGERTTTLLAGLDAVAASGTVPESAGARARASDDDSPVFVFPGQGAHWPGMGARLWEDSPVFAEALRRCAKALSPWIDFDVVDVLRGVGGTSLESSEVVQPALFAMYVSLAEMWKSQGVRPVAVIGHSQGEIAAAYVAGALSLPDAARVVAVRSRALRTITTPGAMASLALPAQRAETLLARWGGGVEVAAVNGPTATTVGGDADAVDELLRHCDEEGVRARRVAVDYASHCFHMEAVREELPARLTGLRPRPAEVPVFSSVTGEEMNGDLMDPDYWYRGLRQTVRFDQAVRRAMQCGHRQFVEVSPHPILVSSLRDIATDAGVDAGAVATLRREAGGAEDFADAVAEAWVKGVRVDWTQRYPDSVEVDLPSYPFQRSSYWLPEKSHETDLASAGLSDGGHPWLAVSTDLPDGSTVRSGRLSTATDPWLADHAVFGGTLVPATAMVELLLHGAFESGCGRLEDVVLHAPLPLTEDGTDLQVHTGAPDEHGRRPVSLHSRARHPAAPWVRNAVAVAAEGDDTAVADRAHTDAVVWPPEDVEPVDVAEHYRALARKGYQYGPAFRAMTAAWRTGKRISHTEATLSGKQVNDRGFTLYPPLLDAALHGLALGGTGSGILLPHTMDSITVRVRGATTLRTTLTAASGHVDAHATDCSGRTVVDIEGLRLRPSTARMLRAAHTDGAALAFDVAWRAVEPAGGDVPEAGHWSAVGTRDDLPVAEVHAGMEDLIAALPRGGPAPEVIWLDCRGQDSLAGEDPDPVPVRERLRRTLADTQAFLADARLARSLLVLLTRRAHSTSFGEPVDDLAAAACAGLFRSVQKENPGSVRLVDVEDGTPDPAVLAAAVATGEPQLAVRGEHFLVPRLIPSDQEALELPAGDTPWRLEASSSHTFDDLKAVSAPTLSAAAGEGAVRVRVEAAGVNFRDTLVCLGLLDADHIGWEIAGTVEETGPGVTEPRVGDQVMAFTGDSGAYASIVEVDHRYVFPIPHGTSLAKAAGITVPFVTAYHALHDLAGVRAGEKVLVHAAAGGVGTAAVQLLRARGADVYATAGVAKQALVAAMGVLPDHIADSRSAEFEPRLRDATGGTGFDVVVGSLAGEFVDASLRLLRPGGRYVELGTRDVRDPEEIAARYPGVTYRAFRLIDHPPQVFGRAFDALLPMFEDGTLEPLPTRRWGIRYARQALRRLSQGRTTGKAILTPPGELGADGTVLVTGGTGSLGGLLAVHLATAHRVRHLLLVSRRGAEAPGTEELRQRLEAAGASVTFAACDAADRAGLAAVLDRIPAERPLTAVVHTAGMLDDGLFTDMTPERLDTVLRSKVDAAVNLHDLTRDRDLRAFVLYSSVVGVAGAAGQSTYAAGNAFLDALAHHRRRLGLPAVSIAWGYWREETSLTARLDATDWARVARQGFAPMATAQALRGFDASLDLDQPAVVITALRELDKETPALLADLPRRNPRGATRPDPADDHVDLSAKPAGERLDAITALVRTHAAAILGHSGPDDVRSDQPFQQAGFDSLASVELRTRLSNALGVRLAATALLDHPTPVTLARYVDSVLAGAGESRPDDGTAARSPSFVTDVLTAWRDGDADRARSLLEPAARQRQSGGLPVPDWRSLTSAPAPHTVVCVPPIITSDVASPYDRLAAGLEGVCEVRTARLPGFVEGEPVPGSLDDLCETWARALPDDPVYLLGHSSGGLLAHRLTEVLRQRGTTVRGLVLLDSVSPAAAPAAVVKEAHDRLARAAAALSPDALTAFHRYERLLSAWTPAASEVPTLFVHPRDSRLPELWPGRHDTSAVDGTHLSMIEDHAPETARSIRQWLAGR
ncbi:type I polyketide synthase [Amycolatopsis keratiniphila]|uniref:Polyketide synthase 7 n=1 Tax=Amycolatopsis keratiniphila TaxID=129921 RepID=R4SV25_9PSEU|nr:type I polyketide synthase [Amycolatopsis keratiniphila]AGM07229.1 polyketide synthase 7 [Amycolatopsis keratiniphila]